VPAVEVDLSGREENVPERFVPDQMQGDLIEAEHLVRYWWASDVARGRRVLDAGCGVGYGTNLMSRAGASAATGVDVANAVIEAAIPDAAPGVSFVAADLKALPFEDASFDVVVCFEVIEHVEAPEEVIAELTRVLAPEGVLLVSSPNPDAYVPGNPHHVREFRAAELREIVDRHLAHSEVRRQFDWVASAVVDDAVAGLDGLDRLHALEAAKAASQRAGTESYAIVIASDAELPQTAPRLVATGVAEPRRWLELYADQQRLLDDQRAYIERQADFRGEVYALQASLRTAEQEIARLLEALKRTEELAEALEQEGTAQAAELENRIDELSERLERADRVLANMYRSPSWRITAPLRMCKRLLRR
jgi:2-polyprenyl-3-methyl-5-hydroxy-6-metoxy-1,4-benzoquinol methylase